MNTSVNPSSLGSAIAEPTTRPWWRSPRLLLAIAALQFVFWQLLTMPLPGDSTRNLHWGLLTLEQPGFLLGNAVDTYERNKGFPPDPPELSERQLYVNGQAALHRWWGPLVPLLFGGTWWLTGSYTLLRLVVPLAGAGAVLLTYMLARSWLPRPTALLAALFLAFFPLFRDFASTAYSEAVSACVLTAALLAYVRGRPWLAVLAGTLGILTKMDVGLWYLGTVGCCAAYALLKKDATLPRWHHVVALLGPLLLASPWVWWHYLRGGSGGPTRGLSLELFGMVASQMLELLFYVPWFVALLLIAAIGACVMAAFRQRVFAPFTALLLGVWLVLGLLVALVYAATPGAGNSPRVIIPALPPLAILFAAGFSRMVNPWRRRVALLLVSMFVVINVFAVSYYAAGGLMLRSYMPAWEYLRTQERGFVLTEQYWPTMLFARQPATWFEFDAVFQQNIMQNREHFARYVGKHPIRYVILPHNSTLASAEVQNFLNTTAAWVDVGSIRIYILDQP